MTTYTFKVEEVDRNGYIAWDAIEESSDSRFPLNVNGSYEAGKFPEITEYLKNTYESSFDVTYIDESIDSLNDLTWKFNHGDDTVIVKDIPRTVLRLSWVR